MDLTISPISDNLLLNLIEMKIVLKKNNINQVPECEYTTSNKNKNNYIYSLINILSDHITITYCILKFILYYLLFNDKKNYTILIITK